MNTFGQGPTSWAPVRDTADGEHRARDPRRAQNTERSAEMDRRTAAAVHDEPSRDFVRQAMNDRYR
jgi:hypothetical protein